MINIKTNIKGAKMPTKKTTKKKSAAAPKKAAAKTDQVSNCADGLSEDKSIQLIEAKGRDYHRRPYKVRAAMINVDFKIAGVGSGKAGDYLVKDGEDLRIVKKSDFEGSYYPVVFG